MIVCIDLFIMFAFLLMIWQMEYFVRIEEENQQ